MWCTWKMGEAYSKVNGKWVYLYRAAGNDSATIDVMLSESRDRAAVFIFSKKRLATVDFKIRSILISQA